MRSIMVLSASSAFFHVIHSPSAPSHPMAIYATLLVRVPRELSHILALPCWTLTVWLPWVSRVSSTASPVVASPLPISPTAATTAHLDAPLPDIALLPEVQAAAPLLKCISGRSILTRQRGTPGCTLPDNHIGLCSCATVGEKRTRNAIDD